MRGFTDRARASTAGPRGPIRSAHGRAHRAAHVRGAEGAAGPAVRGRLGGLLGATRRHRGAVGDLGPAVGHFVKVSRSYRPGLFARHGPADLPRTTDGPEQLVGSHRYHERRAPGREGASPALVLRGGARLIAAPAARLRGVSAAGPAAADPGEWRKLRAELEERRQRRVDRHRFRRNPDGYLRGPEAKLNQSASPP